MRSPTAHRFDPPARKWQGTTPAALGGGAFEAWLRHEADVGEGAWASLLHHGGLWIDRQRWRGEAVPAGVAVTAYLFATEPQPIEIKAEDVLLDGEVVAIAKPAWLCTQGTRASERLSVEAEVRRLLGRPELVAAHRLDRETTGVLLFSAPGPTAAALHARFREGTIEKIYHCRVATPLPAAVTVEGPLVRVAHPQHSLFALQPGADGLTSRTDFAPLPGGLVEARPHTGRTHQIRAHLAWLGHPIAGDTLYHRPWQPGDPERTLLHAQRLVMRWRGAPLVVEAPSPADLAGP